MALIFLNLRKSAFLQRADSERLSSLPKASELVREHQDLIQYIFNEFLLGASSELGA